jgi:hypothetical protein
VSIVGYDETNFYYMDTCGHSCRSKKHLRAPVWSAPRYGDSFRPNIWRVKKDTVLYLVEHWQNGYMVYTGPSQEVGAGH